MATKFLLFHLKEIQKQCIEVYYKIYICFTSEDILTQIEGGGGGGGQGRGLVTKSRWSFSDFTNNEEDNFIFTISLNTRDYPTTGFIEFNMGS